MRSVFGVPAHPLLVHLPVVLLPLAALGVLVMALRPSWHRRYRWAVLAVGTVGTVGAILAASAGESLEGQIEAKEGRAAAAGWEDHAGMGDTARLFAIVLLTALALFVFVPWFLERRQHHHDAARSAGPRWVGPALAAVALVASAASVYTVIQAGHSGAKAAWCETNDPPNCAAEGS